MVWLTPIVHIPPDTLGEGVGLVPPVLLWSIRPTTFIFLAILAHKNSSYWYRWGQSLPIFLTCICVTSNLGCKRCHRELQSACEYLRTHSFFFLQRLYRYTAIPLTPELTELRKGQILYILVLSAGAIRIFRRGEKPRNCAPCR